MLSKCCQFPSLQDEPCQLSYVLQWAWMSSCEIISHCSLYWDVICSSESRWSNTRQDKTVLMTLPKSLYGVCSVCLSNPAVPIGSMRSSTSTEGIAHTSGFIETFHFIPFCSTKKTLTLLKIITWVKQGTLLGVENWLAKQFYCYPEQLQIMANNTVSFKVRKSKNGILECISEMCSDYWCLASYKTSAETQQLYLHMPLTFGKCEYIWFVVEVSSTVC